MALFSVRSERQLCERLEYDMLQMVPSSGRITVGADRGYDTRDFVWDCRDMHITPHVAQRRHSAIDGRTTRHGGYRLSQRVRKRVEEVFGWVKTVGVKRRELSTSR